MAKAFEIAEAETALRALGRAWNQVCETTTGACALTIGRYESLGPRRRESSELEFGPVSWQKQRYLQQLDAASKRVNHHPEAKLKSRSSRRADFLKLG
jgi:hypothetical protein